MANGEIWTAEDARRCREVSRCADVMLGRGAVTDPSLVDRIRGEDAGLDWPALVQWQQRFLDAMVAAEKEDPEERFGAVWTERGAIGRYKQWLAMLTRAWPQAGLLFQQVKKLQRFDEVRAALQASAAIIA